MIELAKDIIETGGFKQLITGFTRQAPHQDDSLIDHIWTNCAQKSIRHFNEVRDPSDHNVIGCDISIKDLQIGGQNILKRAWTNFDKVRFIEKMKQVNWSLVMAATNVDIANSTFEEIVCHSLHTGAPMGIVQSRTQYNSWITDETKVVMLERDKARLKARVTDDGIDWNDYRRLRNDCTARQ